MPAWWNGRHWRLKISWPYGRAGSSPAAGTTFDPEKHRPDADQVCGDRGMTSRRGLREHVKEGRAEAVGMFGAKDAGYVASGWVAQLCDFGDLAG